MKMCPCIAQLVRLPLQQIRGWLAMALVSAGLVSNGQAQAPAYSLVFGPGEASHEGNGLAVDAAGNIYVAGQYQGQATIAGVTLTNAGAQDYFLASFTSNGAPRWAVGAGTASADYGTSVKVAANGDVIVSGGLFTPVTLGNTNLSGLGGRDAVLARYSAAGSLLWARIIGGTANDEADEAAVDGDGNILLVGRINGVVTIGTNTIGTAGRQRQYIAKFDAAGNPIWARAVTTETAAAGTGVALDGNNNILFTGQERTNSQNFVRVAKYDSNGQELWVAQHLANSSSVGTSIAADDAGNVYVCGTFASSTITFGGTTLNNPNFALRGFVTKYSSGGAVQWASRVGGRAYRLSVRPDGTVYTCGFFLGTSGDFDATNISSVGGNDGFVTKHTGAGQIAWVKHAGSASREILRSITTDSLGRVHVTGEGAPEAFDLPPFSFSGSVVVARLETAEVSAGPTVRLVRSATEIILSWPANESGYQVEATPDLNQSFAAAPAWLTPVANQTNVFTAPLTASNWFFRLTRP